MLPKVDGLEGVPSSYHWNKMYQKSIEIYEDIARQSVNNSLLKYGVKGHLLNAGLCHLCKGDVVSITNTLDKYQDLDPTFVGTRECRFLSDAMKTTLLLREKEKLQAQDNDDDDLT